MFRTPITAPWNVVSMVCLESAILQAPSVFTTTILNDSTNAFKRYVHIDPTAGAADLVQDYWTKYNINAAAELTSKNQTNLQTIQSQFLSALNTTMDDTDVLAKFLDNFVQQTRAFKVYLGPYTVQDDGTYVYTTYPGDSQPAWIGWHSFQVTIGGLNRNNGYMDGYVGDAGAPNYTNQSQLLWTQLSAKLKQMQNFTFSILALDYTSGQMEIDSVDESKGGDVVTTGVYNFTSEFRLTGKWVKVLGYNPFQYSDVTTSGKYLSLIHI